MPKKTEKPKETEKPVKTKKPAAGQPDHRRYTWEEIQNTYWNEWIAMTEIDFSGVCCDAQIRSAEVPYHGKTEAEVNRQIPKGVHMFVLEMTKRSLEHAGFLD